MQQQVTTCPRCGSTVFRQKRGTVWTILGILLLFAAIIPGVLVLWLAPKHTECAKCGKNL
jgi:ribosomal protein S27AE